MWKVQMFFFKHRTWSLIFIYDSHNSDTIALVKWLHQQFDKGLHSTISKRPRKVWLYTTNNTPAEQDNDQTSKFYINFKLILDKFQITYR